MKRLQCNHLSFKSAVYICNYFSNELGDRLTPLNSPEFLIYNEIMAIGNTFVNAASDHNAPLVVYIAHTADYVDMLDFRPKAYLLSNTEFSSLTNSGFDWNKHLSPWPADRIAKGIGPFDGKADIFLNELEKEVIDELSRCHLKPSAIYIAGYSLAGLFALYSLYKTDLFDGVACCSGSLWYPGFTDFVKDNEFCKPPKKLYMSLGDKESSVKNPVFASVGDKTREVYEYYKFKGIGVEFEINPGNHMSNVDDRVAKGISRLITNW